MISVKLYAVPTPKQLPGTKYSPEKFTPYDKTLLPELSLFSLYIMVFAFTVIVWPFTVTLNEFDTLLLPLFGEI